MAVTLQIFDAKVMHKRLFPKVNAFVYRIYYLAFPFSQKQLLADGWRFGVNQPGLLSFYEKDHGDIQHMLTDWNLKEADGDAVFVVMPRVLGYGFNPVCFWLLLDKEAQLRGVIAEVNNTFGERHFYVCAHEDHRIITKDEALQAQKLFHVSPFMERSGTYLFRFDYRPEKEKLAFWIDYYHADGRLHLMTSLIGTLRPYTAASRRRLFYQVPLISFKVIALIHWHALKLLLKRIRYVSKPEPLAPTITSATSTLPNVHLTDTSS